MVASGVSLAPRTQRPGLRGAGRASLEPGASGNQGRPIKIHASGFNKLLESIFFLLLVVEAFSLQKVVKILQEVLVSWQEVR